MFFRVKRVRGVDYVQLVENTRVSGQPRQVVHVSCGRLDRLKQSGFFERLVENISTISGTELLLTPAANKSTGDPAHDGALISQMVARMLSVSGLRHTAITLARRSGHPAGFRRLLMEALFAAEPAPLDNKRSHILRRLVTSSVAEDPASAKALLERSLSGDLQETRGKDLYLSLRAGDRATLGPSLARGLLLATVLTESGKPISFELCPAFMPVPQLALELSRQLKSKFGCERVIVMGEPLMANPRMLAQLERAGVSYIFPVHENRSRENVPAIAAQLECHELRAPSAFLIGSSRPRFIRMVHQQTAETDSFLRNLQLRRLDRDDPIIKPTPKLDSIVRRRLEASEAWDGASVFATNLPDSPQCLSPLFFVDQDVRQWAIDLARFGEAGFEFSSNPEHPDQVLEGWSVVALLAHSLRHFLLTRLNDTCGLQITWSNLQHALRERRRARLARGGGSLLTLETGKILTQVLDTLDLTLHQSVAMSSSSDDDTAWEEGEPFDGEQIKSDNSELSNGRVGREARNP